MKYTAICHSTARTYSSQRRLRSTRAVRTAHPRRRRDLLVLAYHRTYGLPVTISRCSNNYGPYHFPEKLIPLMIANALNDKPLPVYGKGENVRDWLYVEDHCRAIDLIIHKGRVGEVYNVGGHNEMKNIDIVKIDLQGAWQTGKPDHLR